MTAFFMTLTIWAVLAKICQFTGKLNIPTLVNNNKCSQILLNPIILYQQTKTFRLWSEQGTSTNLIIHNNSSVLNSINKNNYTCGLVVKVRTTKWVWLIQAISLKITINQELSTVITSNKIWTSRMYQVLRL